MLCIKDQVWPIVIVGAADTDGIVVDTAVAVWIFTTCATPSKLAFTKDLKHALREATKTLVEVVSLSESIFYPKKKYSDFMPGWVIKGRSDPDCAHVKVLSLVVLRSLLGEYAS